MKRSFITNLPDESGAFLKASKVIAKIGANITRVSYNKAVDMHMLFLDVSGTEEQLHRVAEELESIGYIQNFQDSASVILLEFLVPDTAGAIVPVLEVIHSFNFNITYMSAHDDDTDHQTFKMGILVEDAKNIKTFLDQVAQICEVRVIEYDSTEKILDNTVFYLGFANRTSKMIGLDNEQALELLTQSNLLMQLLDEKDEPPHKTFEHIGRFAEMLYRYKGDRFKPRITSLILEEGITLCCIEPPCGSNTYIIEQEEGLLFIDGGFTCYQDEMIKLLEQRYPNFHNRKKKLLLTHPDIDHCGLVSFFDEILVSEDAKEHFRLEAEELPNFRETNPLHAPYFRIGKMLSGYRSVPMEKLQLFQQKNEEEAGTDDSSKLLVQVGNVDFGQVKLDVYSGNGGHAVGEVAFIDEAHKIVFSGDMFINAENSLPEQKAFNEIAPYLMTSVNMDSGKARQERDWLLKKFSPNEYTYCTGHGAIVLAKDRVEAK